ncbi:MAG: hypothetical protein HC897_06585 [Thermoanaerobaculia bacterium]|nr:hypothetical protein [Thermoanaerobaculia bacterium]
MQEKLIEEVVPLVREHLKPTALYKAAASAAAVRRLARRVGPHRPPGARRRADHQRPPLVFDGFPAGAWLLEQAENLAVKDHAPNRWSWAGT